MVALISLSVQEAMAAERARWRGPEVCQSSQAPSSFSIPGDARGVSLALDLSAASFLASGAGFQVPTYLKVGVVCPVFSPSFVPTFAAPTMSLAPFTSNAVNLSPSATRDVAALSVP